jgi:hypothetical protein
VWYDSKSGKCCRQNKKIAGGLESELDIMYYQRDRDNRAVDSYSGRPEACLFLNAEALEVNITDRNGNESYKWTADPNFGAMQPLILETAWRRPKSPPLKCLEK